MSDPPSTTMGVSRRLTERMSEPAAPEPGLGTGLYAIPEAARLSRVSAARIRRWIKGYDWSRGKDEARHRHHSPPVWRPDVAPIDGAQALSFRDLVELRFVDAFLRAGVSWKRLRAVAEAASRRFDTTHPFSTRRFVTDGRTIYDEVRREAGDTLEDLQTHQFAFRRVISPTLQGGLEFAPSGSAVRWWPEPGRGDRLIVVDPLRSFGQPIVDAANIPTGVIAAAAKVDGEKKVAAWFGLTLKAVRAAVRFEASLKKSVK
jgi:uncharacterized protein (DUF433 family)